MLIDNIRSLVKNADSDTDLFYLLYAILDISHPN